MIYRYLRQLLRPMGGVIHFFVLIMAVVVVLLMVWTAVLELGWLI